MAAWVEEARFAPVPVAVQASAWADWGQWPQFERAAPGAVLACQRSGGGHVGEDDAAYHVLDGNQGDCVSIARTAKDRCVACSWTAVEPVIGGPGKMTARAGVPLSKNEA